MYPNHVYKIRGSIIIWTLHNHAHDAFVIWILAQDFDLKQNYNKSSGRIFKKYFLNHLIKSMKCNRSTAQRRLQKAIKLRFIEEEDGKYYLISGRNHMARIAFNNQKLLYNNQLSSFNPTIFFLDDRRYDIKAINLIDPTNMNNTKALLYGLMAIYSSRYLLSRESHANILGHRRNAVIKLSKKARVNEIGTYLLIDPMFLLFQPDCNRVDAINAFRNAERFYRSGSNRITRERVRGREILQRRRVQEVIYLAIQLPNTFTSTRIEKEVPVKFDSFMALLGPGEGASRILSPDRTQKPRLAECLLPVGSDVDPYGGCKEQLLEGHDTFINSWGLAGDISLSDNIINRYLTTIRDMLEDEECRSLILRATGAQNIRHLTSNACRVWRDEVFISRNTPSGVIRNFSSFSSH